MNENSAIDTCNISKSFGDCRAINNLSISVPQGEIFGFIGKNGAGKTTFMRIICGLMKASSGSLKVKKHISFLPQNVRFRDNMNAIEVIQFFAKLRKGNIEECIAFAKELEIDLYKKISSLSPGQQRKLQLVIATIGEPEILVLDEPTAGLDPMGVQQVRGIIKVLNQKGCTIFISSHVLMELENLCHSIAVIEKGELLYEGACSIVYEIEAEGIDEKTIKLLTQLKKKKFEVKGNMLIAEVNRHELPDVLWLLSENCIKVYGVKRQGIEALYNQLIKEASCNERHHDFVKEGY
ncbi:ABC transporter ATP-binding protein [Anaeromicropila populeti]|uniref:ABC-2 type transport system ATP-binding protein n=1 Tax=Anaeromicropila populeti TaxID=37658 RepID=A0A1I6L076_9FIRM|nr:ABC transporter ATP-binding protein [Anaeromicropila populeti]SFR96861.1 ABC-2 type transport system ATP-binding protein [Anaeromicropila populeti]